MSRERSRLKAVFRALSLPDTFSLQTFDWLKVKQGQERERGWRILLHHRCKSERTDSRSPAGGAASRIHCPCSCERLSVTDICGRPYGGRRAPEYQENGIPLAFHSVPARARAARQTWPGMFAEAGRRRAAARGRRRGV